MGLEKLSTYRRRGRRGHEKRGQVEERSGQTENRSDGGGVLYSEGLNGGSAMYFPFHQCTAIDFEASRLCIFPNPEIRNIWSSLQNEILLRIPKFCLIFLPSWIEQSLLLVPQDRM